MTSLSDALFSRTQQRVLALLFGQPQRTFFAEPLRAALSPLQRRIKLALVYGSTAKRTDTALSDIDLLVVSDELSLQQVYVPVAAAERDLARRVSPTLYTTEEFRRRRNNDDSFVSRVLSGEHIVLAGKE
jgi:predicted nucleotidyltransferase